jgi:lipopolysaccharide biosynthesis glycosyltransferase
MWQEPLRARMPASPLQEKEMKTKYKYIYFEKVTGQNIGTEWICYNKLDEILGYAAYCKPWKQCVFESYDENRVFSASCLRDIADFLEQLNKAKKNG